MPEIKTKEDVVSQLMQWRSEIGLGFHPDTSGSDYITPDRVPLFTSVQAREYDARIQECFDVCDELGLDLYQMALDCFLPLLSEESDV